MSSNRGLQLGLYLSAALFLRVVSKAFETIGDAETAPADRLGWHVTALVILLGAAFCFFRVLVLAFRMIRDGKSQPDLAPDLAKVFGDGETPAIGAATRRQSEVVGPSDVPAEARPPSKPGFGRKGL